MLGDMRMKEIFKKKRGRPKVWKINPESITEEKKKSFIGKPIVIDEKEYKKFLRWKKNKK